MVDSNRPNAVATVSIEQAMSSVPPQIGPGGHPRYSQHLERERPGGPIMGYGGPQPPPGSYGNSYSAYPPPPYGSTMHGAYGAGPIPGQPPPGYPRAGYSLPPHSSAYPGYGPVGSVGGFPQSVHHSPYYGGGYESHYGGQPPSGHPSHSQGPQGPQGPQSSYRGPSPLPPPSTGGPVINGLRGPNNGLPTVPTSSDQHSLVSAGSTLLSKRNMTQTGGTQIKHGATADGSGKSSSAQQSPEITQQHNLPDHGEVERLRAAAATEITTEEVKPIQTDFHFFVKEQIDKYRKLAEEDVRNGIEDKSEALDPLLVNSNLNTRIMKAWEGLTKESRDAYMIQEEADRRRFMEDDEIASRHCATLTARGKSPRVVGSDSNKEHAQQQNEQLQKMKKEPQEKKDDATSKTVANKKERELEGEKTDAPINQETKRSAPESVVEASGTINSQGSPSKKSKAGI